MILGEGRSFLSAVADCLKINLSAMLLIKGILSMKQLPSLFLRRSNNNGNTDKFLVDYYFSFICIHQSANVKKLAAINYFTILIKIVSAIKIKSIVKGQLSFLLFTHIQNMQISGIGHRF